MRGRRADGAQVNGGLAIEVDSSSDHGNVQGQEHESLMGLTMKLQHHSLLSTVGL